MNKDQTVEQLANETLKELTSPTLIELTESGKINPKIIEIMTMAAAQRGDKGPMEFSLLMCQECFDQGREEMRMELEGKSSETD